MVSLLASTLLIGLGSISKNLSWFTSGRVYLSMVGSWWVCSHRNMVDPRATLEPILSLVLASDSSHPCM